MTKRIYAVALALAGGTAHAGGIQRPNGISATGTAMGGAFTAFADDATALYFNPGALDTLDPQVLVGGELVVGPRSFTPRLDDGTDGKKQSATIAAPLPVLGAVGRFTDAGDQPSRLTFGAGVWNTFGGKVAFPVTGMPAIDSTEDAVLEATIGASLHVSDRFAIGATTRFGVGLFALDATQNPFDAHLSASGLGVGGSVGALVRPTDTIRIGLTWRSPLHVTTSGDGTITLPTGTTPQRVEHDQVWPQEASLGLGWQPTQELRIAAQIDWAQWSAVRSLSVKFPTNMTLDQLYREDWQDTWTARAGGELAVSDSFKVRAGAYIDTSAVPDRTEERQYFDLTKIAVSAGAGLRVDLWRFDAAVDVALPGSRTVPNNTAATAAFPADRNKAPGEYSGTLLTFELAAARRF